MTAEIPDVPVQQPLVYVDYSGAQVSDPVIGALGEYQFLTLAPTGTANEWVLTQWRITSMSNGALPISTKVYRDTPYAAGGANDSGNVVVVYRGISGDWQMDKFGLSGNYLTTHTVGLGGSSSVDKPKVWVSMDGLEVVLISQPTNSVFQRAWGFDMQGQWLWDVMPPFNEYPYAGQWLGFPRQGRGIWSNDTVLTWMEGPGAQATLTSGTFPNVFTHINSWGGYWQYTGPSGGDQTVFNAATNTWVEKPYEQSVIAGQEWRGSGGTYSVSTAYGSVRSVGNYSGSFYIPDYANGEIMNNHTWDTHLTPSSVQMVVSVYFGTPTAWIRTSSGMVPGTAAYEANKVANGPNPGQIIINGVDRSANAVVQSRGSYYQPSQPEFRVDITVDLTADQPAAGNFDFTMSIESLFPTEAELAAVGRSYSSLLPGGSTTYHYNYRPGPPPTFVYMNEDFPGNPLPTRYTYHSYDEWDFGSIGWGNCSVSMIYNFDETALGGGKLELRDMTSVWLGPREGNTAALSYFDLNDVINRGYMNQNMISQKLWWHATDVSPDLGINGVPTWVNYRYSELETTGDAFTLGDERTIDCTEAWAMYSKGYGNPWASSWKGQVAIVPDIQDPGPQTT